MMSDKIVIVDYGSGNLLSVARALMYSGGGNVIVSAKPADIKSADKLVLPGVGAFGDAMSSLRRSKLIDPIQAHASSRKPLLGICLGMQLLATFSEEFGRHDGLNLIPGGVLPIPKHYSNNIERKVPIVGWYRINRKSSEGTSVRLFRDIQPHSEFYFTHSYAFNVLHKDHSIADYKLQSSILTAAISHNNIYGVQFHPEKSSRNGLQLIKNFLMLK